MTPGKTITVWKWMNILHSRLHDHCNNTVWRLQSRRRFVRRRSSLLISAAKGWTGQVKQKTTISTWTVHTSAKARLTSAVIWRTSMSSRFMSVNHFPYLPIVTNPENNPYIQTVIRNRLRNLIVCSLAHCQPSLKISCKPVRRFFFAKVLTDK